MTANEPIRHSICQRLVQNNEEMANKIAVKYMHQGEWTEITWGEYFQRVESLSSALVKKGIKAGDRVAIYSSTRLEWAIADMAALGIGAVTVPIYPSSIHEDIEFIMNDCLPRLIFCENTALYGKWKTISAKCASVEHVVVFEPRDASSAEAIDFSDLQKKSAPIYQELASKIKLQDLATIVYTSGTTGVPKGVMLSHLNIMQSIVDTFNHISIHDSDRSLTFLPFSHILGRVEHFGHVYIRFHMGYAENIDRVRANLMEIKPTFLVSVPRIFEKIYNGIISQAEASPVKKKIFYWALEIGREVSLAKREKRSPSMSTLLQYQVAKRLVFDKLSEKLGGKLRFSFSGGAPLSKDIAEFFHAAGLLILEGYGLTETTAGIFANSPFQYKFGTVGPAMGDTKLKLAQDGEVTVKSNKVMMGYYNNPTATKEVFTEDGWFLTGDIGELDAEGFLKITDRKKDLIKTAGGKFVAPQKLENLLKLNKYVSNVLIHGDQKKYVVALITLNYDNLTAFAREKGISFNKKEELASHPQVYSLMKEVVADVNQNLGSYESIKNFALLPNDFTIEGGELTPSLKVKRKVCDKKYASEINRLYD